MSSTVSTKECSPFEFGDPEDLVLVCEDCDGSGVIEYGHPNAPYPDRVEKCRACGGKGEVFHPFVPVALADLWQQWAESLMEAIGDE